MKKIIKTNLGGTSFPIEDAAYQDLAAYLQTIQSHYQFDEGVKDIVDDIEHSIAEKLTLRGLSTDKPISRKDIEAIVLEMGTVTEFSQEIESEPVKLKKHLYRDTEDKVIAGVSSGIANYFGIHVLIIRLIFAATVFFGGFGALIYLLFWLVVPIADTASKKIQMQGRIATVSEIEAFVKLKTKRKPESQWVEIASFPFDLIKRIVRFFRIVLGKIKPIALIIIGIVILFLSLATLFVFSTSYAVFLSGVEYLDPIISSIIAILSQGTYGLVVLVAIYLSATTPLVFLIMLGVSCIRRKNILNKVTILFLFIFWFISVNLIAIKVFSNIDRIEESISAIKEDSGMPILSKAYEDLSFSAIDINGDFELVVKKGVTQELYLTGTQKSLENFSLKTKKNQLSIGMKDRVSMCIISCPDYSSSIKIVITTPDISKLEISGSITGEIDELNINTLNLHLEKDSDFQSRAATKSTSIFSHGESDMYLFGKTNKLSLELYGETNIHGYGLMTKSVLIESFGSSLVELSISEFLESHSDESTEIYYIDNSESSIEKKISGGAKVDLIEKIAE